MIKKHCFATFIFALFLCLPPLLDQVRASSPDVAPPPVNSPATSAAQAGNGALTATSSTLPSTSTLATATSPTSATTSATITVPSVANALAADDGPCNNNYDLLRKNLRRIIREQSLDPSRVSAYVADCTCPIIPFELNSDVSFSPGSSMKLLTTAAALDLLGPDFTYKTSVEFAGNLAKKTIHGNLIVRGSGDPTIGSHFSGDPKDPTAVFRKWARQIKKNGFNSIVGSVMADDSYFDKQVELKNWPLQERGEWYVAQISAITFNDNCINILFDKGGKIGKPLKAQLVPQTKYIRFHNGVLMGGKGELGGISINREEGSNLINVTGRAPYKASFESRASVHNPTLYFATVLKETLKEEGIKVAGDPMDIGSVKDKGYLTTGTSVLVEVSPPLSEIVRITNQFGQNIYAESILKTLGKISAGEGSFVAGCSAIHKFIEKKQLNDPDVFFVDGSGLSFSNSITPRFLGKFLITMSSDRNAAVFDNSLAKPGRFGLLEHRLAELRKTHPDASDRIHAVSGLVMSNYVLAGYATTEGGVKMAFVFAINDPRVDRAKAYTLLDNLAATVATSGISAN